MNAGAVTKLFLCISFISVFSNSFLISNVTEVLLPLFVVDGVKTFYWEDTLKEKPMLIFHILLHFRNRRHFSMVSLVFSLTELLNYSNSETDVFKLCTANTNKHFWFAHVSRQRDKNSLTVTYNVVNIFFINKDAFFKC